MDQQGFFQNWNKQSGREQATHRVIPTSQRFDIANLAVGGSDDRLIIHFYPALFNGTIQVVNDPLTVLLDLHHIPVKE